MKKTLLLLLVAFANLLQASNKPVNTYISTEKGKGYFTIQGPSEQATLMIQSTDYPGVIRAFHDLQEDIYKVTDSKPKLVVDQTPKSKYAILAGTYGKSEWIDQLIQQKKIDPKELEGKWEKYILKTVHKPFPGIDHALIIVGSDKRGTIYGIYDLSKKMGVSPWHYWADVPVDKKNQVYVKPGTYTDGEPAVKYRGIFINDEAPALRRWATETFGGLNHTFYKTVFELLLRNKANYLWPAMWLPTMFHVDDPLNPATADEYGIVVSTSHHEPFMRAHNEWYRYGRGAWDYRTNKDALLKFWEEGLKRSENYESVITIGMRGDGDAALAEETAVELLREIIQDQRKLIEKVTQKPASETPQVWAIYKEVQDYYDKGLRVDDDITVLFSDDNWGNIRYLPKKEDLHRKGGYGMYYHFDYVGSPVSYKWQNSTQIERVWEQMKLTYEHGVKNLWIANVGDIKPMELPISFFMDYAWNPDAIQAKDLPAYYTQWVQQQFGPHATEEIAQLLALYTKYNARRTPEMLSPETYSLEHFQEADRVLDEYNQLLEKSQRIQSLLPARYQSAFQQLVHAPIEMCANLNNLYIATGKNHFYAERGAGPAANHYADLAKKLFEKDARLTRQYHEELENGKWNHMMSQNHIGYTFWNHPPINKMPAISYVHTESQASMGYLLEYGRRPQWGWLDVEADWNYSPQLPQFDNINQQKYFIDVFNRGETELNYTLVSKNDWIQLSKYEGNIRLHEKVYVSIDWEKAPKGRHVGEITLSGADQRLPIRVPIRNDIQSASGFVENNGVIAFEASNYSRKTDSKHMWWTIVPNLGRTHSSVIAEPVTQSLPKLSENSPYLEYDFTVFQPGNITIDVYLSPTQDFRKQGGLKFALSIDEDQPQIINTNQGEIKPDYEYAEWWELQVGNHIKTIQAKHKLSEGGKHRLKIWMIDSGIVLQKIAIHTGRPLSSYLGAPESLHIINTDK